MSSLCRCLNTVIPVQFRIGLFSKSAQFLQKQNSRAYLSPQCKETCTKQNLAQFKGNVVPIWIKRGPLLIQLWDSSGDFSTVTLHEPLSTESEKAFLNVALWQKGNVHKTNFRTSDNRLTPEAARHATNELTSAVCATRSSFSRL